MTESTDYTQTVTVINGVEVTVYGGTARPVNTYATKGHVTGWLKRNGARTTYAELTCTCHLHGEPVSPLGEGKWLTYGEEGWTETLNELALAHVTNAITKPYFIRPAGGDRSRWADRYRVNLHGLRNEMERRGLRYSELVAHVADVDAGRVVTAEDGTRFERAR